MKAKEILRVIEDFAPPHIQEPWDNSGLCVGSSDGEVKGVLIGFDCTPGLIDEAVEKGTDMVITHHPLIFKGIKRITDDNPVGEALIKAIKNDIIVYSAHTNADKVISGVSGAMASRLGLENLSILDKDENDAGLGVIGDLPVPLSFESMLKKVKQDFGIKLIRHSAPITGLVSRVAVCGGSGSSLIDKSFEAGADLYITGDLSYHDFFVKKDFSVMDIGHFESEIDIAFIFFTMLKKKFPNFAVRISDCLQNPIYYY